MVILHIASINNNHFSGVCNVVPKHVEYQAVEHQVALLNVNGTVITGCKQQIIGDYKTVRDLPAPFSKPDIIVFHEIYYPSFLRFAFEAKQLSIPYVIIPHGCLTSNAQKQKWLKKKIGNIILFNRFIYNSAAIQYLSTSELERTTVHWDYIIGTNGVDMPDSIKEYGTKDSIDIVYIGRLDIENKAIDLMIDAIESIKEFLVKNNCCIYLYGPDQNDIYGYITKRIQDSQLQQCLVLNNPVLDAEKKIVLENADLFLQTSRSEGMPMGILEALSYGIPCIVTEGTTLGDILEQNNAGWMAKTNNQDIANAIIQAIKDKECWPSMSNNAKLLVYKQFRWEIVSKDVVQKYTSLTNQIR